MWILLYFYDTWPANNRDSKRLKMHSQHLANIFETTSKDILEDLEHIQKSMNPKLRIIPVYCKDSILFSRKETR